MKNFFQQKTVSNEQQIKLPKSFKGILITLSVIVLAAVLFFNSYYSLAVNQQAVITTLGKPTAVLESGPHFKIPFIQSKTILSKEIVGLAIGYNPSDNATIIEESQMITQDMNILFVDFYIEYRIADPVSYVYSSQDPFAILKNLAQNCIRDTVAMYVVDDVITSGKQAIQAEVREKLTTKLKQHDIGIQLINVTIQDAEPPTKDVVAAFKAVETAKQQAETAINNANKYANEVMPAAQAEADKIIKEAEATKQSRINEAEGQVARFNEMYEEYRKFPSITKNRIFFETMQDVLPNLKVIIDSGDGTNTLIPADLLTTKGGVVSDENN